MLTAEWIYKHMMPSIFNQKKRIHSFKQHYYLNLNLYLELPILSKVYAPKNIIGIEAISPN